MDSNIPEQETVKNIINQPNKEITELFSKIESINKELVNNSDDIRLNLEMANNLFDVQQYRKAIPHYKKVLKSNPENVEVRIDLAVSYYNLQDC